MTGFWDTGDSLFENLQIAAETTLYGKKKANPPKFSAFSAGRQKPSFFGSFLHFFLKVCSRGNALEIYFIFYKNMSKITRFYLAEQDPKNHQKVLFPKHF